MHFFFRGAASVIWSTATVITLALLYDFTRGAGYLYFAIMVFSVLLASFSLIFARAAQKNRNWFSAALSGGAWLIAVVALGVMELGYWDSKQEFIASAHDTESLASAGRLELAKNAQASLASYDDVKKSSAQIVAERSEIMSKVIDDKRGTTLGFATKFCARPGDFPKECAKYASLDIELQRAREKERLSEQVWKNATGAQITVRTFDISAPAHVISRWTGLSDATTKDFLKGLFIVLLFIGRDGMLFVASAPHRAASKPASIVRASLPAEPIFEIMQPDPLPRIEPSDTKIEEQRIITEEAAPKPEEREPEPAPQDGADFEVNAPLVKPEKAVEKRVTRAARNKRVVLGRNIVPFAAGGSKPVTPATLESVVAEYLSTQKLTGECRFSDLYPGIKELAEARGVPCRGPDVGTVLVNLGHERFKPAHYRIKGDAAHAASSA